MERDPLRRCALASRSAGDSPVVNAPLSRGHGSHRRVATVLAITMIDVTPSDSAPPAASPSSASSPRRHPTRDPPRDGVVLLSVGPVDTSAKLVPLRDRSDAAVGVRSYRRLAISSASIESLRQACVTVRAE